MSGALHGITARYTGPPILELGLRPFFLGAGLWALIAMVLWLAHVTGLIALQTHLAPVDWHRHELLVGFAGAVIAGFLLTAVPGWTRRPALRGGALFGLFALWAAGRFTLLASAHLPLAPVAALDASFPVVLVALTVRELLLGGNRRNLVVAAIVGLFALGNGLFHVEALRGVSTETGFRIMLAAIVLLVALVGGRVIPSFTRNWLVGRGEARTPPPHARLDSVAMLVTAIALSAWSLAPLAADLGRIERPESGLQGLVPVLSALLFLAGVLQASRLVRWHGHRTGREPLLLILHVGYAFVAAGFLGVAIATWRPELVPMSAALHLWTGGAITLTCMAMMTRAGLGHTGRSLQAHGWVVVIYLLLFASVVLRVIAGFGIAYRPLIHWSAFAWCGGFLCFLLEYTPILARRRITG